jgi:hypothetical protein
MHRDVGKPLRGSRSGGNMAGSSSAARSRARQRALIERLDLRVHLDTGAAGFVAVIDNPYLPLIPGTTYVYRGADEQGVPLRSRLTVTGQTELVDGVMTTVARERKYLLGSLIEDQRGYFAQDVDGNVWCFGSTALSGSWKAGVNGAAALMVMRSAPVTGDAHPLAFGGAPAGESARVLSLNEHAKVPFGVFADCLKTADTDDGSGQQANTLYAPGMGRVAVQSDDGREHLRLAYVQLAPEAFSDTIDNPYYPLKPRTTRIYRGVDQGLPIRLRVNVTDDTRVFDGVPTTVVRERQYEDGELVEDTTSYFAQDRAGNVWFFGEEGKKLDDGRVVSTEGSWLAGIDGATPTIFMRARPSVGDFYRLGNLSGVAEDEARLLRADQRVRVPLGTFANTIVFEDSSPLEPDDIELKYYVPGIGLIMEHTVDGGDEVMRLAYVLDEPAS